MLVLQCHWETLYPDLMETKNDHGYKFIAKNFCLEFLKKLRKTVYFDNTFSINQIMVQSCIMENRQKGQVNILVPVYKDRRPKILCP